MVLEKQVFISRPNSGSDIFNFSGMKFLRLANFRKVFYFSDGWFRAPIPEFSFQSLYNIHEKITRFWLAENSAVFP